MTKITIFSNEQLSMYKGKKVKLLIAQNPPPGFIGEQVEIVRSNNKDGLVLYNPNLCPKTIIQRTDAILQELERERMKVLQWRLITHFLFNFFQLL